MLVRLRRWLRIGDPHAHLVMMTLVFFAFGVTMLVQPGRYYNTPSYANLLQIMPAQSWSVAYLACSLLGVLALVWQSRMWLFYAAHTLGITVLLVWWSAFVIRWITDDGTTIVNVVSWGAFLYLLIRSAVGVRPTPED